MNFIFNITQIHGCTKFMVTSTIFKSKGIPPYFNILSNKMLEESQNVSHHSSQ